MLKLIRKLLGIDGELEEISQENLGSIDVRNSENSRDLLNWILKERIKKVYYLTANYEKGENYFDEYDLLDVGLVLELSNSKWLNWFWIEEGYTGDFEYNVSKRNILRRFHKTFYRTEELTSTSKWKELIGENITDVRFQFEETEGKTYLSKMELLLANHKITVCSIKEPKRDQKIDIMNLEFSTEWSIIVFEN
mgnify:CR=1 FL=1